MIETIINPTNTTQLIRIKQNILDRIKEVKKNIDYYHRLANDGQIHSGHYISKEERERIELINLENLLK